ncbi:MAG: alpha/beta fold hydrolase [Sphingomonas sp.]|uniref:alpha/beta hydrolase family protein n=1 Tax=Sphingomonas sp. TaxID=28214 RepID=UPI0025EDE6A8|nr:alpha/beta fold hydrolase [Sphingomonas sp.]MBX9880399.1 alpha/beta fold hydrolase [Sphingomonas sp.]
MICLPLGTRAQSRPAAASAPEAAQSIDGDWDGTLTVSAIKLRLALHIRTDATGTKGTIDSIDQQAMGIPISKIDRDAGAVIFEIASVNAAFKAVLDPTGNTLTGEWRQGSNTLPLIFTRRQPGQVQPVSARPQTPKRPYPYREEEINFSEDGAPFRLAGTLTLPRGAGPYPAVVLVAGSGPNTRNEPILGHEPFLVIADHLTRHGIAVLRYDKRGTGASGGVYATATTRDFADDAEAALAYLKNRPEVDARHVGLIGHSEGGLIAPIVAAQDRSAAFIVMMGGPGVNGAQVWLEQLKLVLAAEGMAPDKIAAAVAQRQRTIQILLNESDAKTAATKLRALMSGDAPAAQVEAAIVAVNNQWFREFLHYEPAPTLRKVNCPVLVLQGSKDLQVSAAQNLPAIRTALRKNQHVEVVELPGLNHLFQSAQTGGPGEYSQIEETIAPAALDMLANWIVRQATL